MGRPINKRNFGSNANNNLRVQFNNGTSSVAGAIVKQKGSKKFTCIDANGVVATCTLTSTDDANVAVGQMTITVLNDAGTKLFVTKMSAHKVTASDGVVYPWTYLSSNVDGAVQVEETGSDATFTGNVDLT